MKLKLYILALISILMCGCSDEPQADTWVVTLYRGNIFGGSEKTGAFIDWCKTNEDILQSSVPPMQTPSFSYEQSECLLWKKYTHSEAEAQQLVNEFNSIVGETYSYAYYRKHDPNFKGPWAIYYKECFVGTHNNSEAFRKWYEEQSKCLKNAIFVVIGEGGGLVYPNEQELLPYYDKSIGGWLEWYTIIPRATEKEIQKMVKEFQALSITDGENYDTFFADYDPLTNRTN